MCETVSCKVEKVTSSKEAWKILEIKFGVRGSDMQQQDVSQFVESTTNLRVEEQDSERTTEFRESHLKWMIIFKTIKLKPIMQACIWMKKMQQRL